MSIRISKNLFLFALALVLFVIIILIIIFASLPARNKPPEQVRPTPTPLNPRLFEKRQSKGNSTIKATAVSPKEDPTGQTITNPSQKVTFLLSQPVDSSSITVTVTPDIPLIVKTDVNNALIIYPDPPQYWHPNVLYTITVTDAQEKTVDTYQIKVPRLKIQEIPDESGAWPASPR